MSVKTMLAQEKTQLFTDVFEGRVPKRVPVYPLISNEFALQYANKDLTEAQWDSNAFGETADKVCQDFYFDAFPINGIRYPSVYKILGAKNWVMGSNGFIQHPDVEGMVVEDYDALIASPLDCIVERILPRLYSELETNSPTRAMALAKAYKAFYDELGAQGMQIAQLKEKYGLGEANLICGVSAAPFDFVADQLRGFKGIFFDIKRMPDKVEAAVNAVLPFMIGMGMPPYKAQNTTALIPLHMAPYMREKDFVRLYWPGLKAVVEGLAAAGVKSHILLEQDFMRFADYFNDLPEKTLLNFEFGDPKIIKEKLGKKHILTGFYSQTLLKTGTKQQCIDKAKELIEILAPGGGYIFGFDKALITADSIKTENLQAVLEFVSQNANY